MVRICVREGIKEEEEERGEIKEHDWINYTSLMVSYIGIYINIFFSFF